MPECLEPLPLEELELPLLEWPPSPPAVPEGLSAVPEGPPSPPVVPEGPPAVPEGLPSLPAVSDGSPFLPRPPEGDEPLFPPPSSEGDEPPFPPPPPEGDKPPFPPPPPEGDEPLFLHPPPEGDGPPFPPLPLEVPPLLKKAWGIRHQPRPPQPAEIAHPRDIRGLLGGGLGFKGGGGVWPIAACVLWLNYFNGSLVYLAYSRGILGDAVLYPILDYIFFSSSP
ncbi:UNVERIFIED_CONTAM: hypothetical protein FKN15_064063 [Acipenser sinensis]